MNEVKKSLDAVAGFAAGDMGEVKRRVLSGKRRQKKKNLFPVTVTALVAAAILFFTFNVLLDGFSTSDQDEYEVNELIYDFMLRSESDGNEEDATDETKQEVLQRMLQIDALIDYAKTIGYTENTEAIAKAVEEQRDDFYAELDKEGEEKKNTLLQAQEDTFGITYDDYFNVLLKWTTQSEKVSDWLIRHPQENTKTHGEVLGLFRNKYGRAITDFMEQKSIPPFDLSMKYKELEGTVASIEDNHVLVTHGFEEKAEELIDNGAASLFVIDDSLEEIVPGMKIRVVYDALAYQVGSEGNLTVFQEVKAWERIGSSTEPEYLTKNEGKLSEEDIQKAYEMCVKALTDYYQAIWNGSDIKLETFIANENLLQYTQKKIQSQYGVYVKNNLTDQVQIIEIGAWEVEYTDDVNGGYLYLHLPVEIYKTVGSYGEGTEFLVRNVNGKLVIVDWYTGAKDSYDFIVRGENLTIDNPDIWNDREWVKKLDGRTD